MKRKKHVHMPSCISSAWSGCPGIAYVDWVRLAGQFHDQDVIWRHHEKLARWNMSQHDPIYVDVGGEG